MSFEAVLWATSDAPIANVNEFAILVMLAEKADSDGCSAFPARSTVAKRTTVDPKTVQRTLRDLAARKLIGAGDQRAAEYIRADRRPPVWDLLIPYDWFPNVERINKERRERGKPPLTPENRPPIDAPPAKKARSDKGRRRTSETATGRGDSQSSRDTASPSTHGGTVSPTRGDSQFRTGGLEDPRTSPYEPGREPVLPSAPGGQRSGTDGGTDSSAVPHQIERNPGVDLLSAIGAQQPEFLLTGQTLQDQGMAVAGMLMEGWTREQLRQVIAGRPLPDNIHKTVGAVIARRLRDALTGPPPYVGQQFKEDPLPKDKPTPTPNAWTGVAIATDHRKARCPECHRPLRDSTEDVLCSDCREELASV